jgi:hypothetical protein
MPASRKATTLINRYAVIGSGPPDAGFFFPGAVVDPIGTAGGVA